MENKIRLMLTQTAVKVWVKDQFSLEPHQQAVSKQGQLKANH